MGGFEDSSHPLERFLAGSKSERLKIVGMMSGTSVDGVDSCLVDFKGGTLEELQWELLSTCYEPFDDELRERIRGVTAPSGSVSSCCELQAELGLLYAEQARRVISQAGFDNGEITLVASHGQTVRHLPPRGAKMGSTMQIGEGAIIAERLSIPVLSNFRAGDMASMGQGAPLVPAADRILFSRADEQIAIVNIGGMANVTILPPRGSAAEVVAFDTGPGNVLIDLAVQELTQGLEYYDSHGRMAARGRVLTNLLDDLMKLPYISEPAPKSTGREYFGESLFLEILQRPDVSLDNGDDLIASLTRFTASSIAFSLRELVKEENEIDRVLIAGGGAKNDSLLAFLAEDFAPIPVSVLGESRDHTGGGFEPSAKAR